MTRAERIKAVIESAKTKTDQIAWINRFREYREAPSPQRTPSAQPRHETPRQR